MTLLHSEKILLITRKGKVNAITKALKEKKNLYIRPGDNGSLVISRFRESKESTGYIRHFNLHFEYTAVDATKKMEQEYFNLVAIDGGISLGQKGSPRDQVEMFRFIDLLPKFDSIKPYRVDRILALLEQSDDLYRVTFELGKRQIGSFILDPFKGDNFFDAVEGILKARKTGAKAALCLAGGGLEGLLYELGVVRALNSFLVNKKVTELDIYCGISAGAILGGILANKIPPEEVLRAFEGESEIFERVNAKTIYDLYFDEYLFRLIRFWTNVIRTRSYTKLLNEIFKSVPVGFVKGDKLEAYFERHLNKPPYTNDFRDLECELYIGATNQDTSEHVIFGDEGRKHIPITKAIRASTALAPFYAPIQIDGDWYIDGGYTRVANWNFAIEKGAGLVIIVDPLIPLRVPDNRGYINSKGGLFVALQAIKAMMEARRKTSLELSQEKHRDVDFYLFQPRQSTMRIMSGSPMKYNIRTQIARLAYEETVEQILEHFALYQKSFLRYGLVMTKDNVIKEKEKVRMGKEAFIDMLMYPIDSQLT